MSAYWSNIARNIKPYTPGEQPKDKKYIKLNTNENPYPPSPRVIEAIKRAAGEDLRLYPDPTCDGLRSSIARRFGFSKEEVFAGNGSDEILAFAFMSFFNPGEKILFPDISYSFYPVYAGLFQIPYEPVPLDEHFSLSASQFKRENRGIIIANPNAPTGSYLPVEEIESIVECNDRVAVIVDEAYIAFGGKSCVELIHDFPNLLVIRTLSKSHSLAGLRAAFAIGQKEMIAAMEKIKNSFNNYTLDRLALAGAAAAIEDEEYYLKINEQVVNTRERVSKVLSEIGFRCIDSKANFLFISHPRVHASLIFSRLRKEGVLVRYFNKPRIDNYLRVSIGSDDQMTIFLEKIAAIISV